MEYRNVIKGLDRVDSDMISSHELFNKHVWELKTGNVLGRHYITVYYCKGCGAFGWRKLDDADGNMKVQILSLGNANEPLSKAYREAIMEYNLFYEFLDYLKWLRGTVPQSEIENINLWIRYTEAGQ